MSYFKNINVEYQDSGNLDAFSRLRVSNSEQVFAIQQQYTPATIQMERGLSGTGTYSYSTNTRMSAISCTPGTGEAFIQSYQYSPYEPGRSQLIILTSVIGTGVTNSTSDIGYFDAYNGIIFRQNGVTDLRFIQRTSTGGSVDDSNYAIQSNWNIDKLDGTGVSGVTLDITKALIFVIDLQFLGMGRVRCGFDISGVVYYAHQFMNANNLTVPYMQSATLPCAMVVTSATSSVTKTSYFKCACVNSEGGTLNMFGYPYSTPEAIVTAGSGTRTVALSIRPKTTFNGIINRSLFILKDVNLNVTGANPIFWELVVGATITGESYTDINTNFSAYEYSSTPGTFIGMTGGIVISSGYAPGAGNIGGSTPSPIVTDGFELSSLHYPISLNRAGNVRTMGTITLLVTGIGSTSAVRTSLNYREIR